MLKGWSRATVCRISLLCSGAGVLLAMPVSAFAQTAQPAASAGGEEDIIVTARKRDERLQDVPVAITAFTSSDIERFSTRTLQDIAALSPQLIVGPSANPTGTIFLRGIGASDNSPAIDQAVSVNIDGVQVSQAQIIRLGQQDIQRIEILKGPQALFFGKNSPGGVISMVSADPGDKFEARLRTGYEFYDEQKFGEVMLSGPVTDTLGVRADVYYTNQNGWFRNVTQPGAGIVLPKIRNALNKDEYFGRLTLLYRPSDTLDAKLKLSTGKVDQKNGATGATQLYYCPLGAPQVALNAFGSRANGDCKLDRNYVIGDTPANVAALHPSLRDGVPYLTSEQHLGSLTLNLRPSSAVTLTSVTGYYYDNEQLGDNYGFSGLAYLPAASNVKIKQLTQELRAATSFDGPLNFLVGGYYQNFKLHYENAVVFGPPIASPAALFENVVADQETNSYSVFGQAAYKIAPDLDFTVGARYTRERKEVAFTRFPSVLNGFGPPGPIPLPRPSVKFNNLSPEVTLTYKPSSDVTVYGAYRQGFVAGGFNIVPFLAANADNSYRPATVRGGEVGVRGLIFDRQLRFDTTLYHYKYKDLQLSLFDPATLSLPVKNAGAATIYGIETSVNASPRALPGFSTRVSVAYNHSEYNEFTAGCYGGQTIQLGCNLDFTAANGIFNSQKLAGRPLAHAPRLSASAGGSYEHHVNEDMLLAASVDATYSGRQYTTVEENPNAVQDSYWKLNANITLRRADNGWRLALIGKNLTNKLVVTQSYEASFTGGGFGRSGAITPPDIWGVVQAHRTIMIELTVTDALFKR